MSKGIIRVLIVDDSYFFRDFLTQALSASPGMEVAGAAADAPEALALANLLQPNVVLLDMEMPGMRGTDFLRSFLPGHPGARVVVMSSQPANAFEALREGAVEFVAKPGENGLGWKPFAREVRNKILAAAAARRRPAGGAPTLDCKHALRIAADDVVAVGASTGGTEAMLQIFQGLPGDMTGIVAVQHMPPVFTQLYAQRLDDHCAMTVREARDGDRVSRGLILIAPGDKHMRLMRDGRGYYVRCSEEARINGHRPSVDVLFHSVAKAAGPKAVGVLLTGMGSDGARQLLTIRRAGGYTIGQDRATSVIYGMPAVAWQLGAVTDQLPLEGISGALLRHYRKK